MAGSQSADTPLVNDPIVSARLEAISQLGGGISERVAVMDREFNVVYANKGASTERQSQERRACLTKCYESFAHRTEPCEACPAIKIFHDHRVQEVSCSGEEGRPACGMQQAFPLRDANGCMIISRRRTSASNMQKSQGLEALTSHRLRDV